MNNRDWDAYFEKRLAEAEQELADFKSAITKYRLRIVHSDSINGERDMTEQRLRELESDVEEYKAALRQD